MSTQDEVRAVAVEDDSLAAAAAEQESRAPARAEKVPLWKRPSVFRIGSLVVVLGLWELLGPLVNPIFFSYPSAIVKAFFDLIANGELQKYSLESLEILVYGMFLAVFIGIPLGVVMARVRQVDWTLDVYINALYATPMVALVPLLVLWIGIQVEAKVTVVFLFALFPILINTYQGVREVDPRIVEVARSFRSPERHMWRDVYLPWAVPYIAAGIRLAIGRALVGMVIAEFYTSISGLGYMITRYAHIFRMDRTFVPVILLMFMGVALTAALGYVERRVAPWNRQDR